MPDLQELTKTNDVEALRVWLEETGALDIAEELSRLDDVERAIPFRLLAKERALDVFEALDPAHQQELLQSLREERVGELIQSMDPDDRVRLLDEMPAKVANRLRAGLPPAERQRTAALLGYAPESAGRIMTPEYVSLRASMSVADAMTKVRRGGKDAETIYTLPVTDDRRKLLGVVSLRDLVVVSPTERVGNLMVPDVHAMSVDSDQEDVARLMQEADLLAVPIVDHEYRLVGVVTVDDAMEVLEREVTEDVSRAGGVEPLARPYLSVGPLHLARKRAAWLLLLGVAAVLTVNVLAAFEATLDAIVTLSLFIPLLVGTGGNSGAQAATVVIRALAVDEVRFRDLPRVLWRELRVGVLLGLMLATVAFPLVSLVLDPALGLVIGLTLFCIVVWATFAGAALPMLAKRLGLDPAVLSAPLIATLVDATGLLIYLGIARLILAEQLPEIGEAALRALPL